jgi:hypothetical protein
LTYLDMEYNENITNYGLMNLTKLKTIEIESDYHSEYLTNDFLKQLDAKIIWHSYYDL